MHDNDSEGSCWDIDQTEITKDKHSIWQGSFEVSLVNIHAENSGNLKRFDNAKS